MFLAGLYIFLAVLDHILFRFVKTTVLNAVVFEWLIISSPFIYYAFKYEYWLWIPLSFSFLFTQILRKKKVERFLEMSDESTSVES
jgi:hypothetical protein